MGCANSPAYLVGESGREPTSNSHPANSLFDSTKSSKGNSSFLSWGGTWDSSGERNVHSLVHLFTLQTLHECDTARL